MSPPDSTGDHCVSTVTIVTFGQTVTPWHWDPYAAHVVNSLQVHPGSPVKECGKFWFVKVLFSLYLSISLYLCFPLSIPISIVLSLSLPPSSPPLTLSIYPSLSLLFPCLTLPSISPSFNQFNNPKTVLDSTGLGRIQVSDLYGDRNDVQCIFQRAATTIFLPTGQQQQLS